MKPFWVVVISGHHEPSCGGFLVYPLVLASPVRLQSQNEQHLEYKKMEFLCYESFSWLVQVFLRIKTSPRCIKISENKINIMDGQQKGKLKHESCRRIVAVLSAITNAVHVIKICVWNLTHAHLTLSAQKYTEIIYQTSFVSSMWLERIQLPHHI